MILFGVVSQPNIGKTDFEWGNCKKNDSLTIVNLLDATFLTEGYSCDSIQAYRNLDQDTSHHFDLLEGWILKKGNIHVFFNDYPKQSEKMGFFNEKKELKYILYFDRISKSIKGISKVETKGNSVFEKFIFIPSSGQSLDKILLSDFYKESFYSELYRDYFVEDKFFEKEHKRYMFNYLFWLD